jgi:hypothetical protein
MPEWLDPTAWHDARLTLSRQAARIEVAQGDHDYTVVNEFNLEIPLEPLALEFSVDNEILPSVINEDFEPDALDIASLSIRYKVHK